MIVGHQKQREFLRKSADMQKISHAYLFSGQSQLGKKKIALEFIKLLYCSQRQNKFGEGQAGKKPCQDCRFCKDLEKGIHPDFFFVEPQKPEKDLGSISRAEIKISQIRDLVWKLSLRPSLASFKAAIINDAHTLNPDAQNCLLKTLEEPKGKTILILITDYPQILFQTILSRVQQIKFFPVSKSAIENYLKENGYSLKKAQEIALISFGKPGMAVSLAKHPQIMKDQEQEIMEITQFSKTDLVSRFLYVKDLVSKKKDIKETLEIWLRYFRGILLKKIKKSSNFLPEASLQAGGRLAKGGSHYSFNQLRKIIQTIERVKVLIDRTNINQRLALEQIMLEL
ncbi:hypothetical protein IH779_01010 [Patescibacteria group bacterium]|nr:hypothetical protein [Patescibacteria group bacterium]